MQMKKTGEPQNNVVLPEDWIINMKMKKELDLLLHLFILYSLRGPGVQLCG